MSTQLLTIQGNRSLNRTIFPPMLYIHDDLLIYRKRSLLTIREVTISYNQISQVTLNRGIIFSNLEVITTGTDDIHVNYVLNKHAIKAKKIIDQKIYRSHAKHHEEEVHSHSHIKVEKGLARLKELFNKGHIDEKEFKRKKEQLMRDL